MTQHSGSERQLARICKTHLSGTTITDEDQLEGRGSLGVGHVVRGDAAGLCW